MESMNAQVPLARSEGLLSRELPGGEWMVYDTERHQAHTLNRTVALAWRHCDGRSSVADLAAKLSHELGVPPEEDLAWLALDCLEKARLLQEPLIRPEVADRISRRAIIRKLGIAGGIAALLPLVVSMAAPPASAAVSPVRD